MAGRADESCWRHQRRAGGSSNTAVRQASCQQVEPTVGCGLALDVGGGMSWSSTLSGGRGYLSDGEAEMVGSGVVRRVRGIARQGALVQSASAVRATRAWGGSGDGRRTEGDGDGRVARGARSASNKGVGLCEVAIGTGRASFRSGCPAAETASSLFRRRLRRCGSGAAAGRVLQGEVTVCKMRGA